MIFPLVAKKRLAYYIWSVLKGIEIQYRIIISKEAPVIFFQSLTCVSSMWVTCLGIS